MTGTQLIWVVLLTITFIVAILTTPILLITNSRNETTNNSGNNTDSCPEDFTGYCMNGGYCIYLEEQETVACECPEHYGGKRCEKFWAGRAIEDCPHRYHHPNRIQCFLLALKFKQSFADELSYLKC